MEVNWERWGRAAGHRVCRLHSSRPSSSGANHRRSVTRLETWPRTTTATGGKCWFRPSCSLSGSVSGSGLPARSRTPSAPVERGRVAATIVGAVSRLCPCSWWTQRSTGSWRTRWLEGPRHGRASALRFDLGARHSCGDTAAVFFSPHLRAQANTHDPGVAEWGRHRCRGPLHSSKHDLGSEGFCHPPASTSSS